MCGIHGLIHLDGHPVQPHLLSAMGEVTSHCGPDDEGMHIDSATGVAMRRLSIIDLAFEQVVATGKRKIGFVGLSFKAGTDDLRESPLAALDELLGGKGHELSIYHSEVQLTKLLGANKCFIEQRVPHIGQVLASELAEVVAGAELLVLGSSSRAVIDALMRRVRPGQVVIDLVRLPGDVVLPAKVQGLCW